MTTTLRILSFTMAAIAWAFLSHPACAEGAPQSRRAFTVAGKELHFDTGILKGTLAAGGKSLGIQPVTYSADGSQIAGKYGLFSPYRLLTSDARFGTGAWDWASTIDVPRDGSARLHWSPDKDHPLQMTGVYRWTADDTLDLNLTVKPQRDLRNFELFLASYFNGFPESLACAADDGSFIKAVKSGGDWQTFPRDDAAAKLFIDGRWARPPHPVKWNIMPRLRAPLAIRRDAKTGLTAVLMSMPEDCFAISMPHGEDGHRSVYLSLFGRDIKAGEEASASARLVIGKNITDEQAKKLYQQYIELHLNTDGAIVASQLGPARSSLSFEGRSSLQGCDSTGATAATKSPDGGISFARAVQDHHGHQARLTDRFTPTGQSIRWELEIVADGDPWTTPIEMRLKFPATPATRFWTTDIGGKQWRDPLQLAPLADRTWDYGNGPNTICIPIASMIDPATDSGVSLVVSPEQPLLWMQLSTTRNGEVVFRHRLMRLGNGKPVKFTANIVCHEADWRGGLRWMAQRYPDYFNPPNPRADQMAGTASYSRQTEKLSATEIEQYKKMAYRTDWDASFTWPYFGMFMPPMPDADATWRTYGYDTSGKHDPNRVVDMSYRKLNEKARNRKAAGFFTLAYFNVTEFGVGIRDRSSATDNVPDSECWHDANAWLYRKIADGVLRNENGQTSRTWGGAIATDCGGADYQRSLLDQARRFSFLPDYDGIVIDRMDWLPRINHSPGADDQVGWYLHGQPGRFLGLSWIDTLGKLGPIMHAMDKVIFVNCCMRGHRIDYLRDVDGFYDEQGDSGDDLNGSSLLAIRKPALMWTHIAKDVAPDADSYFQRHLHMGAYPTAPFPGNDHTIMPDRTIERFYLDYGPLLDAMRGKKWVLSPHCVETASPGVKVNLFEIPGGFALPVTFAGNAPSAIVRLRNVPGMNKAHCEALQPGEPTPLPVVSSFKDGVMELVVPLKRGCAMVKISRSADQ